MLLAAAGLGGSAFAAEPAPKSCAAPGKCMTLAPVQLFELVGQLVDAGRFDAAQTLLESLTGNRDAEIRAEAGFRLGNLLQSRGDLAHAARAYRAVLDEKPNATPVRLELARVLVALGEEDNARSQLRRASTAGLPADVARVVDIFQLALRSRRRLGGGIEVSLAPDSNVNRASDNATVTIGSTSANLSRDAQAQSGIGATVSSQAFWRPALNRNTNILATASVNGDFYKKSQFNDSGFSLRLGPELLRGRSRYRMSLAGGSRWFGGAHYSDSYGASVNWLRQIDRVSQVQLDLTSLRSDYYINPALDGTVHSAVLRFEQALSARLSYRATLLLERQNARDAAFATWSTGAEILLSRDIGRKTAYVRIAHNRTWGDAPYSLPPERRKDKLIDLELGFLLRDLSFSGFAPVVRLHHTENTSPLFFYAYRRTRVEFGLTREF